MENEQKVIVRTTERERERESHSAIKVNNLQTSAALPGENNNNFRNKIENKKSNKK